MLKGSDVTHLQDDFQTVQRSSSCPGHGSCHRSSNQLPPHQTSPPLLLRELIRHRQMFPNVKHLGQHEKGKGQYHFYHFRVFLVF